MPVHDANWKDSLAGLSKAMQVPDLRKRLLFVAGMFALFVLGLHIPAPFVIPSAFKNLPAFFGLYDMLSGGALRHLSVLAMGVVPYINASIIVQLLGIAVPAVQRMQKEGEEGRKRLSLYTRWGTVILAILQSGGLCIMLYKNGAIETQFGWFGVIPVVIVMAAGTSFLMWMGEQLTDRGIGNGISLIIFAGIAIRLPSTLHQIFTLVKAQNQNNAIAFTVLEIALILAIFLAIVVFITYVQQATRHIPIQHARRVVGNRIFGSSNTYLPLKVVTAGVIPIIFAMSLVMLPVTISQMLQGSAYKGQHWLDLLKSFSPGYSWYAGVIYFLLVVFFTYFYTAVVYNVQDIADNLKKHGSFIPGLRPGKQTEKYIDQVLTRITFAGALFLGVVALLPYLIPVILRNTSSAASIFPLWGGTSLLIVVGVALDTMKQIEAHLVMRHYEGFIK